MQSVLLVGTINVGSRKTQLAKTKIDDVWSQIVFLKGVSRKRGFYSGTRKFYLSCRSACPSQVVKIVILVVAIS